MRRKPHAFLGYFSELRQRKNLKSAAVCQHGTIPVHEFSDTSHLAYQLVARAYVKVISV